MLERQGFFCILQQRVKFDFTTLAARRRTSSFASTRRPCSSWARGAAAPPRKLQLVGCDAEAARVEETRVHLARVGLAELARVEVADARTFTPRPGWNAWVASNLPYGERVGGAGAVDLARAFGARLREACGGYHAGLLVGSAAQADALGLPGAGRATLV